MSALVRDRSTPAEDIKVFEFLPGGAPIYRGAMVGIDNAGAAWPAGNAAVVLVVGRAETGTADIPPEPALTTGQLPAGVVTAVGGAGGHIRVRRKMAFAWDNSTASGDVIAPANWGATVYAVDDHTVALTNGGATRLAAGVCRGLTPGGLVWVEMA